MGALTGTIPSEVGRLSLLGKFLSHPSFTDACPYLLTNSTETFLTDGSQVSGSMPIEVCALRAQSLKTLGAPCLRRFECSCCGGPDLLACEFWDESSP
jgi:hypothetical protein